MAADLSDRMVTVLAQAACVHLVHAGVLGWTTTDPDLHDTLHLDGNDPEAAAQRARECIDAMAAIMLDQSDRPVVRRSALLDS
jgi:hypothetical protein